ncbi:esterase/lipase family protein [Shewanella sp.]|uniref:esterase/lipase family protein n=1 Tax=Shewanella sp. TaxID=50422 RepID=UPI00356563DC
MHAIFVHGLGRTPASGLPMLAILRRAGIRCQTLGYLAAVEPVDTIVQRLDKKIARLPAGAPYILIGHSLGGVIIRSLLSTSGTTGKLPVLVFLLGSPLQPARLAMTLKTNPLFRLFSGDAGQLLGNAQRMAGIGNPTAQGIRCIFIKGTRGMPTGTKGAKLPPFYGEENDGVVAVSEVTAPWQHNNPLCEIISLPLPHTLLPSSFTVGRLIIERLRSKDLLT